MRRGSCPCPSPKRSAWAAHGGRLKVDSAKRHGSCLRPNGPRDPSPGPRPKADALGKKAPQPCGLKGRGNLHASFVAARRHTPQVNVGRGHRPFKSHRGCSGRSSEGLGGIGRAQNLGCQALQVLFIGSCHELGNLLVVFNRVEGLSPMDPSAMVRRLQLYGKNEVMTGQMLELEDFAR
jgi:hypothetical protein